MVLGVAPYIVTNGNGREAVEFYKNALDAEVRVLQTFGEMPKSPEYPMPEEAKDRILHADLKIGNTNLMLSDTFPGQPFQLGDQVTIAVHISTADKAREVFEKLQDGGKVGMPLQETFWSPAYGSVTDKFGVNWQVSTQSAQQQS
jgi:PhnB protein